MRLSYSKSWTAIRVPRQYDLRRSCITAHRRSIQSAANTLKTPARTRFAPSPTGNLHLGSIRTALFNYLIAKKTGGQFLLRIEDTDQKRTVPGAEEKLFDDLQWAGIYWHEGPVIGGPLGPYRQSERTNIYQEHNKHLLVAGAAYRCFCSAERLDMLARSRNEKGLAPGYDRKCFHIPQDESNQRAYDGEQHVVRLRAPDDYPQFHDLVYGKTGKGTKSKKDLYLDDVAYEDPILMKGDGYPTYHFANVVDDHLMQITHVIRGSEWMASTPLHMAIYQAFGWQPPAFAHVALLVDAHGQKLSKRDKASDISFYRSADGVFPDTLVNFAALLGWSHTRKTDVMRLNELEKEFSLKFTKGNATVSFEKLWFLQQRHTQRYINEGGAEFDRIVDDLLTIAKQTYPQSQFFNSQSPPQQKETVALLVRADGKNYSTPSSFLSRNVHFFLPLPTSLPSYIPLDPKIPLSTLRTAATALTFVPPEQWTSSAHAANISNISSFQPPAFSTEPDPETSDQQKQEEKPFRKELYHYLRWALLGGANGPGIPDTMTVLGREESLKRIQSAVKRTMMLEQEQGIVDVRNARGAKVSGSGTREGIKIQKFLDFEKDKGE